MRIHAGIQVVQINLFEMNSEVDKFHNNCLKLKESFNSNRMKIIVLLNNKEPNIKLVDSSLKEL